MKKSAIVSLLIVSLCGGCGSGGSAPAGTIANLTAQEIVEQCLTTDLLELGGILDLLQGLLDGTGSGVTPQIDLLQGILSGGIFPWAVDLDGDTVNDLSGTIHLRDAAGNVTIPLGLLGVVDPDNLDLDAILAALPPGTTLHLTFEIASLALQSANAASGSGALDFEFADGAISNASGSGNFLAGPCDITFGFDDLGIEDLLGDGFPVADLDFDLAVQGQHATGRVSFDGTDVAKVRTRVGGGAEETFDLPFGLALPAPPQ